MSEYKQLRLGIEGMTCNNCALGVKRYLEKKGLQNVAVSFANAEASFEINGVLAKEDVINGIEKLGFSVVPDEEVSQLHLEESLGWSSLEWKTLLCVLLTIPLILVMFLSTPILHNTTVQFLLCLPVFIIGLEHFGTSAIKSLRSGVPNMDVLIAIGSTAAFIYSFIGYSLVLGPKFVFWETAASIITLVLLGNVMEHRAVRQTTSALRALYNLNPQKVKLVTINPNGMEQITEINQKDIKVGQHFLVNTGDRIPTDGKVVWGEGSANEAMMTGESLLVDKATEHQVIGGTTLELGSIKMEAQKIGKDTALSQIIELVKKAQADQPPIHKLADRISAIFVPLVLMIAAATFIISYYFAGISLQTALMNSIAVLVISCPCAMGLATPTALMVGLGRAARNGILVKGGMTLETLSKLKNIVFDKTGTLTTGTFHINHIKSDIPEEDFKQILLGLEKYSTHPLATTIVDSLSADTQPLPMAEVREMKGLGIMGKDDDGNTYMAGSYNIAAEFTDEDKHAIYVLKNGGLVGWVDMEDKLRPDAVQCVEYMKDNNIRTLLISGDNEDKTAYMAHKLGIPEYYSQKLPKEKLEMIDELTNKGTTVMVGDGINDAPALAKATVGIALSSASEVAIDSADVILLNANLRSINKAIGISKHTVITIKQNLFWAFFYNILAIPLAAVGLLSPMIAAFTMALSDVIVIGNSLRLKRKKLD